MFPKEPKRTSASKSLFRVFIYVELALFGSTYYLWKRMNDSQDFRFKVRENAPSILEGYYQLGEQLGGLKTRQMDEEAWREQSEK